MNFTRVIVLVLSLSAVGCAAVSADTSTTSSPSQSLVFEVPNPPPDLKAEEKPVSPGPGHIWVAGYWDYIGGHHVWRGGRWLEGKAGYEYVRARYEWDGRAWQFHVPHWRRRPVLDNSADPQMAQAHSGAGSEGK